MLSSVLTGLVLCFFIPSNWHHLSCGNCLEGKREDYHSCSVLYCVPQYCIVCSQMCSSYRCTSLYRDCQFKFNLAYLLACVFLPGFLTWGWFIFLFCGSEFGWILIQLLVAVQVIAWKDSSLKWPIMCQARYKKTLLIPIVINNSIKSRQSYCNESLVQFFWPTLFVSYWRGIWKCVHAWISVVFLSACR